MKKDKIYFASDFHLGSPNKESSDKRENLAVKWLDAIKADAKAVYLVGDLFDFWHDYKTVVPKGFVLFLAKIKELQRSGIEIIIFSGNHDLWLSGYFEEELEVQVCREPICIKEGNKTIYIAHGDGLGPGDHGYKFIKKVFQNPICQFLFRWLHPDVGIGLANYFSRKSRESDHEEVKFLGEEKEWLIIHSREILKEKDIDIFIYGHRHLPMKYQLNPGLYVNLGDWISNFTFGVIHEGKFDLKRYSSDGSSVHLDFVQ